MATTLAVEAATSLFNLCVVAETFLGNAGTKGTTDRLMELRNVFRLSVKFALLERSVNANRRSMKISEELAQCELQLDAYATGKLVQIVNSTTGFPICKDMVCCWFPMWDRLPFILRGQDQIMESPVVIEPVNQWGRI